MTKILSIGNCHNLGMHNAISDVDGIESEYLPASTDLPTINRSARDAIARDGRVFVLNSFYDTVAPALHDIPQEQIVRIPYVRSTLFHPDCVELGRAAAAGMLAPLDRLHSSIVLAGYLEGLNANAISDLFNADFLERSGMFGRRANDAWLAKQMEETGWDLAPLLAKWEDRGCFLYSPMHPKQFVLTDLAVEACARSGIVGVCVDADIHDRGAVYAQWPVYPPIAAALGLDGNYDFILPEKDADGNVRSHRTIGLDEMIERSLHAYASRGQDFLADAPIIKRVRKAIHETSTPQSLPVAQRDAKTLPGVNPYSTMPDHQYWRRSISRQAFAEVDPVVRGAFVINPNEAVATAGSCFAQHIARTIRKSGFNYFIAETAPEGQDDPAVIESYELYSARYGNIYTARQLKQLFERAYSRFSPVEESWMDNGRFVDPYRPNVDSFETIGDLRKDREQHLAAVRNMVENLDVFVFTLGLTEAWRSKVDGAVFPIVPGASGGEYDPEKHESVNFAVDEVVSDMTDALRVLFDKNPSAKVILTVSPVPLVATFENRHVLASTTYSKSVLRVAAETIQSRFDRVVYFPSYEIITGNFNEGRYFEEDKRGVKPEGVAHVMRLFSKHYLAHDADDSLKAELAAAQQEAEIICDEEDLEKL